MQTKNYTKNNTFYITIQNLKPVTFYTDGTNPLNARLNPICHLLALLAHHILHVSRIRVKVLRLGSNYGLRNHLNFSLNNYAIRHLDTKTSQRIAEF